MRDLLGRFLQSSGIDPVYFVTCIVDVISLFLWRKLKEPLTESQRALFKAVILVALVMTVYVLCKFFGVINDWRDLEPNWSS
ncbi:MAG TPA: hypothetical protein VI758_14145 [Bacteroidota bacterium]